MVRLSAARLRELLRAAQQAAELRELAEFRTGALALVRQLVPCDSASYNEIRPGASTIVIADPPVWLTSEDLEAFGRLAAENPLVAHYFQSGDGQPVRFSDFVSRRQLHSLRLYDEIYRPLGIEHQIAFVLPSPPGEVIGIALNRRQRDFSDEEAGVLDLLRAPLRACYKRLVERDELRSRLAAYEGRDEVGARSPALGLSERQIEVMRGVAAGRSNAEIGLGLGISRRTVEKHLEHIYALLEVTSRTAAIARMRAPARAGSHGAAAEPGERGAVQARAAVL